ncbi:MAG: DegV family protein [Ruminococcaceae bacterium]|nr:DegV family protein [Oscillospiraceae bacterium]
MAKVQILADTCCDLTSELKDQFGVATVPLYVVLGEKMYRDGVDVEPRMLYKYFEETQQTPKTSATTVGDYMDFFRPYVEAGKDIVYIGLSEKMSCTMANARMAAEQFEDAKIFCVDSMNLSTGIGLLVLHAADMAAEGATAEEIVASLEELRHRVRASFVLDTLEYLHRGGRCSLLAMMGASLLSLHPEIAVTDGSMASRNKYRGKMAVAARKYAANLAANRENIEKKRVFVTYTKDTDPEIVDAVVEEVKAAGFETILQTNAGSVISSHCGKNCIGFLFVEKK